MEGTGSIGYSLNLFAGLIVFNLFADSIGPSPGLIVGNKNYVTKVIFPLEILTATTIGSAVFQAMTSTAILIGFEIIVFQKIPLTLLWLPLVWTPLLLLCLAIGWVISSLGVFLRDLAQLMPVLLSVIMFLSAVFYPRIVTRENTANYVSKPDSISNRTNKSREY